MTVATEPHRAPGLQMCTWDSLVGHPWDGSSINPVIAEFINNFFKIIMKFHTSQWPICTGSDSWPQTTGDIIKPYDPHMLWLRAAPTAVWSTVHSTDILRCALICKNHAVRRPWEIWFPHRGANSRLCSPQRERTFWFCRHFFLCAPSLLEVMRSHACFFDIALVFCLNVSWNVAPWCNVM